MISNPEDIEKDKLHILLKKIDWNPRDTYQCILLKSNYSSQNSNTIKIDCGFLENKFKGVITTILDNDIIMLCNCNALGISREKFRESLAEISWEKMLKAGFSIEYNVFFNFPSYCKQTYIALEMGELYNPTLWFYHFEHYTSKYIIHHGMFELPPVAMIPNNIVSMIQNDLKYNSNYFETFKIYLEQNKNILKTANLLFIHVSTMNYRINKIKQLLNDPELETPDGFLFYALICQFIDEYGKDKLISDIL